MRRAWVINIGKYLLGMAVLAWVVHANWEPPEGTPGPGLKQALTGPINYRSLVIAALFITPAVLLTFVRWHLLVRALDLPQTPRQTARLCLIGYFFNTLLPGAIGGDLVKAAAMYRSQDRRTAAFASIIFDRAVGLGGLVLLVVISGAIFFAFGDTSNSPPVLWAVFRSATIAIVGAGLGWILLGLLPAWRADKFANRLIKLPVVGHSAAEAWRALWLYSKRPKAVAITVAMTVVVHVFNVLAFDRCASVFAPDHNQLPSLSEHLVLVPVGIAIKALFPAPGGVGGAEFSYGKMYELTGRPAALGVLASLAFLLATWFLAACAYVAAQIVPKDKATPDDSNNDITKDKT